LTEHQKNKLPVRLVKRNGSLWFALPIVAILLSAGLIVVPALRDYLSLRHAAQGAEVVAVGRFGIPVERLFSISIQMSALRHQGAIILLNAPGHALYLLISVALGHRSHWSPASVGPGLWRVYSFPFCALPAWFFLGRALDAWFASTRLRRADLVIGLTLFTLFLIISAGLRFGLSPQERADQDPLLGGYIYGFALWAGLMTIPVVAWIRQRKHPRVTEQQY
jgi:hypothetical protein